MRFILQDDVYDDLPPDWDQKVAKAKAFVDAKVDAARTKAVADGKQPAEVDEICLKARHKAINSKASVWRATDAALRIASHDKCWYCESKQERSDKPVDHFRPKNSVIDDTSGHPGYYWLAFEWRNFRLSCTFCNSKRRDLEGGTEGGKQDHFPILPPPPYAHSETDPIEHPKLLDPVDDKDTKLLTFLTNGFPHPAKDAQEVKDRVEASIKLYHLDQVALIRKRKRLAADIEEHVEMADDAIAVNDDNSFRHHKKEIIKKVRAKAEYSAAARIYLSGFRAKPWIQEILDRDL